MKIKVEVSEAIDLAKRQKDKTFDLIFIDPPFGNNQADWDGTNEDFDFLLISHLVRMLKTTGSFYIKCGIGPKSQSLIDFYNRVTPFVNEEKLIFQDMITWKKNRGRGNRKGWLQVQENFLWYTKSDRYVWNEKRQYLLEKRTFNILKKGNIPVNKSPYKRITNVWTDINEFGFDGSPKEFHQKFEEVGHATPTPEKIAERIIMLHTNPDDWIFDCFAGSGIVPLTAQKLERNCIAGDRVQKNVNYINNKIKNYIKPLFDDREE